MIGAAPFAISIVLTIFMGGLGLGSYLAGKYIDRLKGAWQYLRLYALLEIGIGLLAFILPALIKASQPIFAWLYNQSTTHLFFFNMGILLGALVLFILPTALMGATLPILIRFYVNNRGHLGVRTGQLYAINTIGAAIGALLSGFLLIKIWGVTGTLFIAVLLNLAIGALAFLLSLWLAKQPQLESRDPESNQQNRAAELKNNYTQYSLRHQWAVLLIFAVSGFAALAYEVIWTRLLALIIGPTTYSFTIVLTTFIIGLALGASLFGWMADRSKSPLRLLLYLQFCAAMAALIVSQFLGNSQFFFAKLIYVFQGDLMLLSSAKATILFLILLAPTLALGATFPLVAKIYTQSIRHLGRSIGFAYAINTAGALLGSFLAGFVLIPFLGKENSLSLIVSFQLLVTFSVYHSFESRHTNPEKKLGLIALAILSLVLALIYPKWDRQQLATGKYYRFTWVENHLKRTSWWDAFRKSTQDLLPTPMGMEVVFYGDGMGGFTTVEQYLDPMGRAQFTLYNSGKADASTESDMSTQTLAAHIPMLFHRDPEQVMILGLASGVTAGEALYYEPDRLDILEISDQVVEASDFFKQWNNDILTQPGVNLILQDGRAHLELTDRNYDVIVSEPSNPWMAGLANLFTEDFFLLAKNCLNMDGIFVQWLPSYQMDWETFSMVGRTFGTVFPNSLLLKSAVGGNDYFLIGFKGPDQLHIENAKTNLAYLQRSPNLTVQDPRILYRLLVSDDLVRLFGEGPIHTDNRPILEFVAPQKMHIAKDDVRSTLNEKRTLDDKILDVIKQKMEVAGQLEFARFALSVDTPFRNMIDLDKATAQEMTSFSEMMLEYSSAHPLNSYDIFGSDSLKQACLEIQVEALLEHLRELPDRTLSYVYLANAYGELENHEESIRFSKLLVEFGDDPIEANLDLAQRYLNASQYDESISTYQRVLALDPENAFALNNLGAAYEKTNQAVAARNAYAAAILADSTMGMARYNLARFQVLSGELDSALAELELSLQFNPGYIPAYFLSSNIHAMNGAYDQAAAMLEEILEMQPDHKEALIKLAEIQGLIQTHDSSAQGDLHGENPGSRFLYNRALEMIQQKKYQTAIGLLDQAVATEGDDTETLVALGVAYQGLGWFEKAIETYQRALILDQNNGGIHNNMAMAYFSMQDLKQAMWHTKRAQMLGYDVPPDFTRKLQEHH